MRAHADAPDTAASQSRIAALKAPGASRFERWPAPGILTSVAPGSAAAIAAASEGGVSEILFADDDGDRAAERRELRRGVRPIEDPGHRTAGSGCRRLRHHAVDRRQHLRASVPGGHPDELRSHVGRHGSRPCPIEQFQRGPARRPRGLGVGRGARVCQQQSAHAPGETAQHGEGRVPAHRASAQRRTRGANGVHQRGDVPGVVLEARVLPRHVRVVGCRAAEAPEVGRHGRPPLGHRPQLRLPHRGIQRKRVKKDNDALARERASGEVAERAVADAEVAPRDGKVHGGIILGARGWGLGARDSGFGVRGSGFGIGVRDSQEATGRSGL